MALSLTKAEGAHKKAPENNGSEGGGGLRGFRERLDGAAHILVCRAACDRGIQRSASVHASIIARRPAETPRFRGERSRCRPCQQSRLVDPARPNASSGPTWRGK